MPVAEQDSWADVEAIKQLKARYCRLLDTKDWAGWRDIFTDDFVSDTTPSGGVLITGADEFVAFLQSTLGKPSQPTVHQVHAPEIELTSPSTATGHLGTQRHCATGPRDQPCRLRPLPRDLREDRRAMADQDVHPDPAARRCLQSLFLPEDFTTAAGLRGAAGTKARHGLMSEHTVLVTGAFGQVGSRCAEILTVIHPCRRRCAV